MTSLLCAVRDLQQFRLIEFSPESSQVALTPAGSEAATAIKGASIRKAANRLLGEAPK